MTEGEGAPRRILLVEDSMIIALDTEECLLSLGASHVEVHAGVRGALAALEEQDFDCALLDFNLGSETSEAVAMALAARDIPFWLATGYGELADKARALGARGVMVKPYGRVELARLIQDYAALRD